MAAPFTPVCAAQRYSVQVKRRLVEEPQLPDSTAHLENMVSAFVSFKTIFTLASF